MEWQTEDLIQATLDRVERAMFDPHFVDDVPRFMAGIERAEIVELREDGPIVDRAIHYYPSFSIPWFAKRVAREMAEFTEYLRWDRRTHAGTFRIEPNMPEQWRAYFNAAGSYTLSAGGDGSTARKVTADLTIRHGIMSGTLPTRIIVGIIKRQFRREARLLASRA